jgi:hypothetical protein
MAWRHFNLLKIKEKMMSLSCLRGTARIRRESGRRKSQESRKTGVMKGVQVRVPLVVSVIAVVVP